MRYEAIDNKLFIENRKKLAKQLKSNSLAIINSHDEMPKNADQLYKFRQHPDVFYLSGIDQAKSVIILFPDAPNEAHREILLVEETNELIATWEGYRYTKEDAIKTSGIKTVLWVDELDSIIQILMYSAENCYLNLNEHLRFKSDVPTKDVRFAAELKAKYPLHNYIRLAPIMAKLRAIKSDTEIKLIKTACDITDKAFRRVLQFVKPGVWEYEIEAEVIHEFIKNRATRHAYDPIIAKAENACVLHYVTNNAQCHDGDFMLIDFGAEYANYAADLSRAFPINGTYTKRQKEVYNAVLKVFKAAQKVLVPGTTIPKYHEEVWKMIEEECIKLGLITKDDVKNQAKNKPAFKKYCPHGISHHMGLAVHDVADINLPIEEGMVFTIEPGLYIPEEKFGVRIENDFLVTKNGLVDLMSNIPIEVEEIEDIMQSGR